MRREILSAQLNQAVEHAMSLHEILQNDITISRKPETTARDTQTTVIRTREAESKIQIIYRRK